MTIAGFSLGPASVLAFRSFLMRPMGRRLRPRWNLLRARAWTSYKFEKPNGEERQSRYQRHSSLQPTEVTHVDELLVGKVEEVVKLDTPVLVLLERPGGLLGSGFLLRSELSLRKSRSAPIQISHDHSLPFVVSHCFFAPSLILLLPCFLPTRNYL